MKTLLPKIRLTVLTTLCVLLHNLSHAQFVTIPDINFRNWLSTNGFSQCITGNQLDTTCPAVLNAAYMEINSNAIHRINGIRFFKNLDTLKVFGAIDSLEDLPARLKILQVSAPLKNINYFPDSLLKITTYYAQLSQFPPLPPTLEFLYSTTGELTSLPDLPPTILLLDCVGNRITTAPQFAGTQIQTIRLAYNQLTSLPALPSTVTDLTVSHNALTVLPALPLNVFYLDCGYNQLSQLPTLPPMLFVLSFDSNLISTLPVLPLNLRQLGCALNGLSAIDSLPPNVTKLTCNNNQLTSIPANLSLDFLDCSHNAITDIQALHIIPSPNYNNINCSYNQLTHIDITYDSITTLNISNNPNLTCMPVLNRMEFLNFDSTAISCLPAYGIVDSSTPALSTLPLCNYNGGCPAFWNLSGQVFIDDNANCAYNTGDSLLQNIKIQLWQDSLLVQETFTGGEGFYSFKTAPGNYAVTIDTAYMPFIVACPLSGAYPDTVTSPSYIQNGLNFGLACRPQADVGAWSIIAPQVFRPANFTTVYANAGDLAAFYGQHCANSVSGTVTLASTGPCSYVSPAPGALTPSSVSGNVITWNVADFGTAGFDSLFAVVVSTDTFAQMGQQACFTLTAVSSLPDYNTGNDTLEMCFEIANSHDPNDKQVSPAGNIEPTQEWLTYTIRFQNTGNAEAQNIHIEDTIDLAHLDISTLQLLAYSHAPETRFFNGNIVSFNFYGINLPDSFSNEPASHGYVQFKIKVKGTPQPGEQIKNTAYIYFDFNPAVVTNTTLSNVHLSNGLQNISRQAFNIRIVPNPANDIALISTNTGVTQGTIFLTDMVGRTIVSAPLQSSVYRLQTSTLPASMYFVTVKSGERSATAKLLVR